MIAAICIAAMATHQITRGYEEAWVLMGLAVIYAFFAIRSGIRGG